MFFFPLVWLKHAAYCTIVILISTILLLNADVPEGAIIIREHTALNNLFSCLWFNEVHLFTPRDQLSFGYVVYRLGGLFKFFMFPNCEYNSIFVWHPHTREHSSKVEWAKSIQELKKHPELIERRGGLGLWTKYPGDLDSVVLPPVTRSSKAGRWLLEIFCCTHTATTAH